MKRNKFATIMIPVSCVGFCVPLVTLFSGNSLMIQTDFRMHNLGIEAACYLKEAEERIKAP